MDTQETAPLLATAPCILCNVCDASHPSRLIAAGSSFASLIGGASGISIVFVRAAFDIRTFRIGFRCFVIVVHVFLVAGAAFVITGLSVCTVGHS